MDKSKLQLLRFPAAFCFLGYIGLNWNLIFRVWRLFTEYGLNFYRGAYLLHFLVLGIMVIGLLLNKPSVAAIGFLGILMPLADIWEMKGFAVRHPALGIVFFVFLLLCCINLDNAIVWGSIASVSKLAVAILGTVGGYYKWYKFEAALLMVGVLLLGLAFQKKRVPAKVMANASSTSTTTAIGTETAIEKLTKLKQLLDEGIITQEEFEAKKKQLLGL